MSNNLSYTYEILSVNTEGRFMEVLYKSEGRENVKVGVRLPFEGESLEKIIASFLKRTDIECALLSASAELTRRSHVSNSSHKIL